MVETKFTKGPWQYRPLKHDDWGFVRGPSGADGYSDFICQAKDMRYMGDKHLSECRTRGTDPWAANAHLIAAAPELYEALRGLQREVDGWLGAFEDELREVGGNTNFHCMWQKLEKANAALAKARGEQS